MCVHVRCVMSNQTELISGGIHYLHGSRWLSHAHTHQTHEGEISHHTISMAITKTSVSAAWRKELQGVCERISVCWDWTGAIFPLVLTGIVLGLDGWVSGFGLVQAVSYVFVWMHVFTYLPLCSSVPPLCSYQLKPTHHTPTHFHIIHDIMCMTLCDSPCVFIWLYVFFLQSALKCLYVC